MKPTISVYDPDEDNITCKYYLDSEVAPRGTESFRTASPAKTVAFANALDLSILPEGGHSIRLEVVDETAVPVTQTINFKIDRSVPTLVAVNSSSSYNSITLSGSATDSIAGLDPYPYRYTLNGVASGWLTASSNTWNQLPSNTQYNVLFEARDAKGHIANKPLSIYTKAQPPSISVGNAGPYSLDLSVGDTNPASTLYQITANDAMYVTQEGTLTSGSTWIPLPAGKKLTARGLTPSTAYTFKVKAKNAEGIETAAAAASGTTLVPPPAAPANITAKATSSQVALAWDTVPGASGYDVEADGTVKDNGTSTTFTHTGLTQNTQHAYRVRSRGEGGAGEWSAPVNKSTLPNIAGIPMNIVAAPSSNSITIVWDSIGGATGYDIEADGELVNNGPTTNYTHKGLAPGTHHTYKIRSINSGGKSEWSGYVNASTLPEAPLVPSNLKAAASKTEIALSWDKVDGAAYDIEVDGTVLDNGAKSTYTHAGLEPGTQHSYRVRARKAGSAGDWSSVVTASTTADVFGAPGNVKAEAGNTSVVLTWDSVNEATGYDVEADGVVLDNGTETRCVHNGLEVNTQHTYRVRAKRGAEASDWSVPVTVDTYHLPAVEGVKAEAAKTAIIINWTEAAGAEAYDLEFDGVVIENIKAVNYTCTELQPNTQHSIRIRAKNSTGVGAWSEMVLKSTLFDGYDVPQKVTAISRNTSISVVWSEVAGSGAYDLEADGQLLENITGTQYVHTGLTQGTQHTYKVRARNGSGTSGWSKTVTAATLPNGPTTPANLTVSATVTSVLITWDESENASGYDIELDGKTMDAGAGTSYTHSGLNPGTQHTYRVRSKNVNGASTWSEIKTISTRNSTEKISIDCTANEIFNVMLTASDINVPDGYTYTITYNPAELEVADLCAVTAKADAAIGCIAGSDIKITQLAPGRIVFIKTGIISPGEAWSGYVNSIKFKAKAGGKTEITYSIQ